MAKRAKPGKAEAGKLKDLAVKDRGKDVKGGRTWIGTVVRRIVRPTARGIAEVGGTIERTVDPR